MSTVTIEELKKRVRAIGGRYPNRLDRARRIYVEERACALQRAREVEYAVKLETAKYFEINYNEVLFCGSTQLGFSATKDTLFEPGVSDLDLACVNPMLFQKAWMDVLEASRAFTDDTAFAHLSGGELGRFKDQLLRRGMIRISLMPKSPLVGKWREFEDEMSRRYNSDFGSVSVAIYVNEYAFCWKQDAALSQVMST